MATTPKRIVRAALLRNTEKLREELTALTGSMVSNPSIDSFTLKVNRRNGVVKATAVGRDRRTVTKEILGPGLEVATVHTPSDKNARDRNIRALRAKGHTQIEIADRLNVSQSLVSLVLRS